MSKTHPTIPEGDLGFDAISYAREIVSTPSHHDADEFSACARETDGAVREAAERLAYTLTPPISSTDDGLVLVNVEDARLLLSALSSPPRPDFIRCALPRGECCHQRIPPVLPPEAPECNDGDDCCRYCGRGLQPCGACKPAAPPADAATEAVEIVRNILTAHDAYITPRGTLSYSTPVASTGFIAAIRWLERVAPTPAPAPSAKEGR